MQVMLELDYLRETYQNFIGSVSYVISVLHLYFWHILFGGIAVYYISTKFLGPILDWLSHRYDGYKKQKEDDEYAAKYHKDPDLFAARMSAQQANAKRLQEKYDLEAKDYQTKLNEKAIQKRRDLHKGKDNDVGGHTLQPLRSEYNPLSPGGSANYRPPKRSKCGSGGCG